MDNECYKLSLKQLFFLLKTSFQEVSYSIDFIFDYLSTEIVQDKKLEDPADISI